MNPSTPNLDGLRFNITILGDEINDLENFKESKALEYRREARCQRDRRSL